MDIYAENILDHSKNPRNTGEGAGADVSGTEHNPSCGDSLSIHLWLKENGITKIEWQGEGCAISQAGMSILSENLVGMTVEDILSLDKDSVYELLGVPVGPRRYKCALLCLHTLKNTLLTREGKEPQSWLKTVEIDED